MAKKQQRKNKLHPVTVYAEAVVQGEILAGRLVRLACRRHLRDLKASHKRGLRFDEDLASHAIDFFPQFLSHGEDKPFNLSPHQAFIIGSLFGWIKRDGYRRFRHAYIEEGKGDGKTPLASGILLYGLIMDGEENAELYTAAVTRDQAGIAFRDCKQMAARSAFANRLEITEHNIAYPATNSFIRPVSSEARSLDGKRVFMCVLDEIHEHPTNMVIDKMTAGNKGRMQPMNIRITNSGYDRTSVCWHEHEYSREILEQLRDDDDWFAYICQLDPCDKCLTEGKSQPQDDCPNCDHWSDERVWVKANPNLDITVTSEYLRSEVKKALAMPSKANTVKRLNFCIWTENISHWLPMDDWDECGRLPFDREALKGRRCFAGLDLADTSDTASLLLIFPPDHVPTHAAKEDGTQIDAELIEEPFHILRFTWIPEEMKKRTGQERARFQEWISQGFIEGTPGNLIDYRYILKTIGQCRLDYDLKMLAFDRWGSQKIVTDLCDDYGFTVDEKEAANYNKPLLVNFGQGFASMNSPTKEFSNLVIAHKIAHGGDPVMRWYVGNVVVSQDSAGNQKPDKGKSTEKIDGAISAIMALDLAVRNPAQESPVYVWTLNDYLQSDVEDQ